MRGEDAGGPNPASTDQARASVLFVQLNSRVSLWSAAMVIQPEREAIGSAKMAPMMEVLWVLKRGEPPTSMPREPIPA